MMRVESEMNLFQRQFLDISALPSAISLMVAERVLLAERYLNSSLKRSEKEKDNVRECLLSLLFSFILLCRQG